MVLLPGRNKVLGQVKQGGRPDSAHGPSVCYLCSREITPEGRARARTQGRRQRGSYFRALLE